MLTRSYIVFSLPLTAVYNNLQGKVQLLEFCGRDRAVWGLSQALVLGLLDSVSFRDG